MFFAGLLLWLVIGVVGGIVARVAYRTADTVTALTVTFGVLGAFIGGMLGTSAYVHHDPSPWRLGGLLGAVLGALAFSIMYHFVTRKAV